VRVVVVGPEARERVVGLRARGVVAVGAEDGTQALHWARAWGFTHVADADGWRETLTGDRTMSPLEEERGSR
jgi:hypothetical protein